jgi:hypothetical protein
MEFTCKGIAFQYSHKSGFLEVTLPSGRKLSYPQAELIEDEYGTVSFTSRRQRQRCWSRTTNVAAVAHRRPLLENITQGSAAISSSQ